MTEAISIILGMAMLASLIGVIVGVVIGFRTKRWKAAVFTLSAFMVVFTLTVLYMGLTGELDEPDSVQVVRVTPEPASMPTATASAPTSMPEPVQASLRGLGFTRTEIQLPFERAGYEFNERLIANERVSQGWDREGTSSVELWGPPDDLERIVVSVTMDNPSQFTISAFTALTTVIPEWLDVYPDWVTEAAEWTVNNPTEEYQLRHDDTIIALSVWPIPYQALLTIEAVP